MPPSDHEKEKIERLRRAMYSRTYADKLGPRERRSLESEHSGVPEDWQHKPEPVRREDLPLEAMLRPQRKKKSYSVLKLTLLTAAVFFVGAILFFGYYLFFGGASSISARNIDIAITGPTNIASAAPSPRSSHRPIMRSSSRHPRSRSRSKVIPKQYRASQCNSR